MLTRLLAYLRGIAARRRSNTEADDELQFHIEQETAANIARGMAPDEARRVVLRDLGGMAQTAESVREVRTIWFDALVQDSTYAWRRFARERGLVVAAVLTSALGIGGTTATYSVVYGVLLRPLPVVDEDTIAVAYRTDALTNAGYYSYSEFEMMRRSGAFEDVAATSRLQLDLTGAPGAERIDATSVSDNFFRVLGIHAAVGRALTAEDRDAPEVRAVISDALWRRRFGADPSVVGRTLTAVPVDAVIVGVMPPGFERVRENVDAWLPIERATDPAVLASPGYFIVRPIGRLAEGASLSDTNTILEAIPASSSSTRESGVRLARLRDDIVPHRIERLLLVVFAVMLLTWLVMCANLSLLLLERGVRRSRELAVRLALGARRARIAVQMLIESTWLAVAGGALGVGLASWAVQLFVASGPPAQLDTTAVSLDGPVLAFAIILITVTAMLSGIAPALCASRARTALIAREATGTPDARLSHMLIVGQIAVALVVLAGASLLVRSLLNMQRVELGFDGTHVLAADLSLPTSRYGDWTADNMRYLQVQRELMERLAAIPGVDSVTIGSPVFVPGNDSRVSISLDDGRRFLNGEPTHYALAPGSHYIGPGYMRLHGIRVVSGREFHEDDDPSTPHAVIVNETMAKLHWPDGAPIGQRVNFGRMRRGALDEPWATIIGVVADVRHGGLDLPVKPEIYRAQLQHPRPMFSIVVRTGEPSEHVMSAMRQTVRTLDPDIPLFNMRVVSDRIAETTATARYSSALLSGLAGIVVVLCAIGLFSLLAGAVAARRREMAIRMALGAAPRRVVAAVIARAAGLLVVGTSIGIVAALIGARTLSGLLYDVEPLNPVAHVIGVVVIALTGIGAAWIPARRASAIDPVIALRADQ